MADIVKGKPQAPQAPTNVATVTLPPGMTQEQFNKLFGSFTKSRDYTAKHDKAVREALVILRKAHEDEYKGYLATELRKQGLQVK